MSKRPHLHKFIGRRLLPVAAPMTLGLMLVSAPGLWGQADAAPGGSDVKIEVLDVTTGTGSRTQQPVVEGGAVLPQGGQAAQPLPILPVRAAPRPLTPEQQALVDKHSALMTALEQWHYQSMSRYNINVAGLADPFLPIQDVRGRPEGGGDDGEDYSSLPPLLRMDLSQLKLVAITVLSNNPGGALASFEDALGNSYILRVGDRIGRNNGRVLKITQNVVTVEERGRRSTDAPRITDIKLNVLSSDGLTIMNSQ